MVPDAFPRVDWPETFKTTDDRVLDVRLDAVVVARVEVPVTANVLVVVLLVVVRFVMNEVSAEKIEEKRLDEVAFVEKRLVAVSAEEDAVASTV